MRFCRNVRNRIKLILRCISYVTVSYPEIIRWCVRKSWFYFTRVRQYDDTRRLAFWYAWPLGMKVNYVLGLDEKCSYSEFLRSVFSRIRTENGETLRISLYSVQKWENTEKQNSNRSVKLKPSSDHNFIFC